MGVVKLPWVDQDWFIRTPFNYCDHFGDKKILAKMCLVCHEEVERRKRYKELGLDPYDLKTVFREVAESLIETSTKLRKKAEELGDTCPPIESFPIFRIVVEYGNEIGKLILQLQPEVETEKNKKLVTIIEVLAHSRFYVGAKIGRAIDSRWEEQKDPQLPDDSKTSAFFAYLAIKRNCLVLKSLGINIQLLEISHELCQLIRKEFFPNEKVEYKEWGCEYLESILAVPKEN